MRKRLMRTCQWTDAFGGLCSLEGTGAAKVGAKSEGRDKVVGAASSEPRLVPSTPRRVAVRGAWEGRPMQWSHPSTGLSVATAAAPGADSAAGVIRMSPVISCEACSSATCAWQQA